MKKRDFDIIGVLIGVFVGLFLGYLIGTKLDVDLTNDGNEKEVEQIVNVEYVYLLQVAKFDNAAGALNYQEVLNNKEMDSIVVNDGNYYYIYGGIASKEEDLTTLKNKYYVLGYETIVKRELLIDKANSIIDNPTLYEFYSESINNLYNSLNGETIVISEKYYINPVNIELFTQLQILISIKNDVLKQKAQLQAYKLIIEKI